MSSSESNLSSAPPPTPPQNKPQSSLVLAALTLGLLGALVWAMAPARSKFTPAPLLPVPNGCPKNLPDFVPSDVTEAPSVDLKSFSNEQRNHILFRLNMEPCPCGCNLSIAACRISHTTCPVCKGLVEKIVAEERQAPSVASGR
jgi:hypothetical protein